MFIKVTFQVKTGFFVKCVEVYTRDDRFPKSIVNIALQIYGLSSALFFCEKNSLSNY